MQFRRRVSIKVGVVQDGSMIIQGDYISIGQFGIRMTNCLAIGTMNFEFRQAFAKRRFGRDVSCRTAKRGQSHDFDFVRRFHASAVVQNIGGSCRVDPLYAISQRVVDDLADNDAFLPVLRQVLRDVIERVHDTNIELIGPVTVRCTRHDMPIIVRLKINQQRSLTWRVHDV